MAQRFSSSKNAIAECDRCGFRYQLRELRHLTIKTKRVALKVCPECWEEDHPQLKLGMYPVDDPQAVMDPRPDANSYYASGILANGSLGEGSRVTEWGWNPIGGARGYDRTMSVNSLNPPVTVHSVTVATS